MLTRSVKMFVITDTLFKSCLLTRSVKMFVITDTLFKSCLLTRSVKMFMTNLLMLPKATELRNICRNNPKPTPKGAQHRNHLLIIVSVLCTSFGYSYDWLQIFCSDAAFHNSFIINALRILNLTSNI